MLGIKCLILGHGEEPSLLNSFLEEKEIETRHIKRSSEVEKLKEEEYDVAVVDDGFVLPATSSYEEVISKLRDGYKIKRIYGMSNLHQEDLELPLEEDGHLYKPLGKKDLEIFYRALINNEKRDLVFIFLGLRFYASLESAAILKSKVTNLLLESLENDGLVGVDIKLPPVNLTPTFSNLKKEKKKET